MIPEEYYKAGNILAKTINKTRDLIKPGINILEICEFIEGEIEKLGAKPSFPANIDINEIGAHYTSPPNDKSKIPDNSVVKIDAGSHINGYINDMAITINFGEKKYDKYIEAAEAALATAINHIKPGVKVDLIGELVEKKIKSYDLKPISNLSGHQLKQYNLHAGQSIPSVKSNEEGYFKINEVYALEPFVTDKSAAGRVKSGNEAYIYQFIKRKKNLIKFLAQPADEIRRKFNRLPFCLRWLPEKYHTSDIIKRLTSIGILHAYPVLIEARKGVVAQAEKTIVVTSDGCEVLTGL
ncbi:MAG: type II methionyl aminopeptidase [Candidatus Helarchaeota archaeon]|nr:type II methionyl aminopeptidase [Candidatus Helarchaeota archaeon]